VSAGRAGVQGLRVVEHEALARVGGFEFAFDRIAQTDVVDVDPHLAGTQARR
jgi:hypothetical protein